ncbi:MAG: lamin tail domain-containing protein [Pirellulales bacterium]
MRSSIVAWAVLVGLVGVGSARGGPVVINEFMADNRATLLDDDGDYSDWIELYNSGAAAVDLGGWYLTDDAMNLTKWAFPSMAIDSNEYLLVFASGKDRRDPLRDLHANFRLNSRGEYLGLVMPDGFTVAHDYVPAYPPQQPDVAFSYGLWQGMPEVFLSPTPRGPNAPEPSTLVLGISGLLAAAIVWRRRKVCPGSLGFHPMLT